MDIPESLCSNRAIAPYISRASELELINPIVSYYCKIYVLEYILSNKLHAKDKDVEGYTIGLLDETEAEKTLDDAENSNLTKVLNDKNLSFGAVLQFTYQLVNDSLGGLLKYDGTNKAQLVGKFKACLNFLNILLIFYNKENSEVDYPRFAGEKIKDGAAFAEFNKEKIKVIKYNLARLLKDKVPIHQNKDADFDKELEDEFEQELRDIEAKNSGLNLVDDDEDIPEDAHVEEDQNVDSELKPTLVPQELPTFVDDDDEDSSIPVLPGAPKEFPKGDEEDVQEHPSFELPGVPRFLPDSGSGSNGLGLPGAPNFLPDSDISHINKHSSIHVIPPSNDDDDADKPKPNDIAKAVDPPAPKPEFIAPKVVSTKSTVSNKKESDITEILSTAEAVAKIQKHAKFAVSALNYEDFATAEKELLAGLKVLRDAQK